MSKSIRKVIKKRSKPYEIQRFEREDGYYDEDGIWIDSKEIIQTVNIYWQPITDKLNDGVEAQRQVVSKHGWSIDILEGVNIENVVKNKDRITIGSEVFTVSNLVDWGSDIYREFDLTRSGEAENLSDS